MLGMEVGKKSFTTAWLKLEGMWQPRAPACGDGYRCFLGVACSKISLVRIEELSLKEIRRIVILHDLRWS
ncbi:hypothetical protein DDT91_03420 [Algoriphagus sp. AK58]|nr:hypothetical protein [Algoriphagus sp. AK58]